MLFVELEILFHRHDAVTGLPQRVDFHDGFVEIRIGQKTSFYCGRLVAIVQMSVTKSLEQALGHIFVDVRNLLVAVIDGGIVLRVVFQTRCEKREARYEKDSSE